MYHFGTKTPLTGGLKNTCASMPNYLCLDAQRGTGNWPTRHALFLYNEWSPIFHRTPFLKNDYMEQILSYHSSK